MSNRSFLEPEGLYTPGLRFAFTNITNERFTSKWGGVPVNVEAGETIEISDVTPLVGIGMGHNLAVKFTIELVDKIVNDEVKMDNLAHQNIPYYKSPKGANLGVPAARKILEDKILQPLTEDAESPARQSSRAAFKAGLEADLNRQNGVPDQQSPETPRSFENLAPVGNVQPKVEKKAARTKRVTITKPVSTVA